MRMATGDPPRAQRTVLHLERRMQRGDFRPRYAAAVIAAVWAVAIVIFGIIEHLIDPESFGNIWVGMWWATGTVTTVGYGDVVPGQTASKAIAVILMIGGLSLFAVVTGTITSLFVERTRAGSRQAEHDELQRTLATLSSELAAVREHLETSADEN